VFHEFTYRGPVRFFRGTAVSDRWRINGIFFKKIVPALLPQGGIPDVRAQGGFSRDSSVKPSGTPPPGCTSLRRTIHPSTGKCPID